MTVVSFSFSQWAGRMEDIDCILWLGRGSILDYSTVINNSSNTEPTNIASPCHQILHQLTFKWKSEIGGRGSGDGDGVMERNSQTEIMMNCPVNPVSSRLICVMQFLIFNQRICLVTSGPSDSVNPVDIDPMWCSLTNYLHKKCKYFQHYCIVESLELFLSKLHYP